MKDTNYIISLDLDGTLLNKDSKISEATKNYLIDLDKQGYHIVIATGRPVRNAKKFYDELNLHTPMICYNGAKVIHPHDKTFKPFELIFPRDTILEIMDLLPKEKVEVAICETDECVWITKKDEQINADFWYHNVPMIEGDFHETLKQDTVTFLLRCASQQDTYQVKEIIESKYPHLKVRVWQGFLERFAEIYIDGTSKASGLEFVRKYCNTPMEHTIAFGDSENDIEIVTTVAHGYAMKNSDQSLLDHVSNITEFTNNEDGVMRELQKLLK